MQEGTLNGVGRWTIAVQLATLSVAAVGCTGAGTTGELGVAELQYADGYRACEEDCSLDVPLATGGRAWVFATVPWDLGRFSVRAVDPSIVEVNATSSTEQFRILGLREGETTLEIVDSEDEVVDRFGFHVHDVAFLVGRPEGEIRLGARERYISLGYEDAERGSLRGLRAIEVDAPEFVEHSLPSYSDVVGRVNTATGSTFAFRESETLVLSTDQSGSSGTVTLRAAGGNEWQFDIVAAVPVVDSIALEVQPRGENATVNAELTLDNPQDRVLACCTWTVSPADAGVGLSALMCRSANAFNADLTRAQEADVVCTSQGVEARTAVQLTAAP